MIYFKRPYAFTAAFLAYKLWRFIQAKFLSHCGPHYAAPGVAENPAELGDFLASWIWALPLAFLGV